MSKESLKQECINRSAVFYRDVMRQVAQLCIQDYENLNKLGMLLEMLETSDDKHDKPNTGAR